MRDMKLVDGTETAYGRGVFIQALEVIRSSGNLLEREQAACLAQVLDLRVSALSIEEALATDIMALIEHRLAERVVVESLLSVLRRRVRELAKLTGGVERLAERAQRRRHHETLGHLVLAMLGTTAWRDRVRSEWARATLSARDSSARRLSKRIIQGWLDAHGSVPDWMRAVLEEDPSISGWGCLSDSERWQLHRAAPTTQGWRWIARGDKPGQRSLAACAFGDQLDQAIETLQAAMAEEPNGGRRVVLARWLTEIAG
jgi:hypothetical protein